MTNRPDWISRARTIAFGIRRRVLEHTLSNNGGYLSQACSSAEMLATLYTKTMNIGPSEGPMIPRPFAGVPGPCNPDSFTGASYNGPKLPHLDRFIFSPVHYALVLYSTLIEVGRLAEGALDQFNVDGSSVELIGAEHSPGHEVTAGSLAQAVSQAGGIALARKLKGEDGKVWVFMSDGEFQEGQTWEAVAALVHHKVDNIRVVVDANGQQCDELVTDVMLTDPLAQKLQAFGAHAVEVDAHDPKAFDEACGETSEGRPLFVIGRSDPCKGLTLLKSRAPFLHYVRFKTEKERDSYQALLDGWSDPSAKGGAL